MPARKSYKNEQFTKLRTNNGSAPTEAFTRDNVLALAKLQAACLRNKCSYYCRSNRDSSVTVRIYDSDDKYEETLSLTEDWDLACEEMIEALWGLPAVGLERRTLVSEPAERLATPRKPPASTKDTSEGANGA